MNLPRFYLPEIHPGEQPLPEDQSHHALHVLRMNDSDEMVVFDGSGKWARAKLLVRRKHAYCRVDEPIREEPPPALRITLACATPKADRGQTLVEQASQTGVIRLIWLDCDFSVVQPAAGGGKMQKWQRLAVESAKQCGRNWLLDVQPPQKPAAVLKMAASEKAQVFWANPRAVQTLLTVAQKQMTSKEKSVFILIGPEGGWSEDEQKLLSRDNHVIPVSLNSNILRIETAAIAAAAVIQAVFYGNFCLPSGLE